jgi:hypothetical protein
MQVKSWSPPRGLINSRTPMTGKRIAAVPALPGSGSGSGSGPGAGPGAAFRMMGVGLPGVMGNQPFGAGQSTG